ncbi:hypothetical protein ACFLTW_05445 [Chloroflexota bacterium]
MKKASFFLQGAILREQAVSSRKDEARDARRKISSLLFLAGFAKDTPTSRRDWLRPWLLLPSEVTHR